MHYEAAAAICALFFVQLWCTMRQPRQFAHFFLFSYDALWGSRGNMRTFFVQLWCTMRQPRQYAHFFCSAMMHYEAAAAICALGAKGDKSLAKEGLRHCDMAIQICDRYYYQEYRWFIEDKAFSPSYDLAPLPSPPHPFPDSTVSYTGDTQTANERQFAEGRGMRVG